MRPLVMLARRLRRSRPAPARPSEDWQAPARTGMWLLAIAVVTMGGWAALARLDSAVIAPGAVAAETARQTVQHLEGGIIRAIHVRDGQRVARGDLLFSLDETAARAQLSLLETLYANLSLREARLAAERARADDFLWSTPRDGVAALDEATYADERARFRERRELRQHQKAGQQARLSAHRHEHAALELERRALGQQLSSLDRELAPLKALLVRHLVPAARVSVLERERSRIEIALARISTEMAKADRAIAETQLALVQEEADFHTAVLNELMDVRRTLAETQDRLAVARDAVARLQVMAPLAGIAQARRVSTIGAVVKPGDILVEISPLDAPMLVKAQIDPMDIDRISSGLRAEIRFTGMKIDETASVFGTVRSVSNDRVGEQPGQKAHYLAEIDVDMAVAPRTLRERIRIGMPATVLVATGERSAARYLLQPLGDALALAMRER